jgi:hypothetical protein
MKLRELFNKKDNKTNELKKLIFDKRLKSLEERLDDKNLVWWNSLPHSSKRSVVHRWIDYRKTIKNPKIKHFIKDCRKFYRIDKNNYRDSAIDYLLKN